MKFEGLCTAIVTPVKDDKTDTQAMGKLVDYVIEGGSDCLLVLGGTGEYNCLTHEQRITALECCVEKAAGRVPIIAGVLCPGLYDAIENAKAFKKAGADAAMLVTPYYSTPDHQGLVDHHLKFMDHVDLPLIVYNIPYRTMVDMKPHTVAEIVEKSGGQVVGMKVSGTDIPDFGRLSTLVGDKITLFGGEETLLAPELLMGAKGAILASPNVIPRFWRTMMDLALKGDENDIKKAFQMQMDIQPFIDLLFGEGNPGPLKVALKLMGIDCGEALLPLHAPAKAYQEKIAQGMKLVEKWMN